MHICSVIQRFIETLCKGHQSLDFCKMQCSCNDYRMRALSKIYTTKCSNPARYDFLVWDTDSGCYNCKCIFKENLVSKVFFYLQQCFKGRIWIKKEGFSMVIIVFSQYECMISS